MASQLLESVLTEDGFAKVQSVFETGFNLHFKDQLIYVSGHQPGYLSAIGLQLKDADLMGKLTESVVVDTLIRKRGNTWTVYTREGGLIFELADINYECFRLEKRTVSQRSLAKLSASIQSSFDITQSGFGQLQSLKDIWQAWQQVDSEADFQGLVYRLVGHGPGLTPSGDDFLQGVLLMEASFGLKTSFRQRILAAVTERETSHVSQAYYSALLEGYVNEPWYRLLQSFDKVSSTELRNIIQSLLRYGHTSGSDMVLGSLAYLEYLSFFGGNE
ncbi:DUF2877 domain-containing protein [Suicoccus acidiformans]|nr:DUF2877 domain-containing protein [Suicoccus acidiformans]